MLALILALVTEIPPLLGGSAPDATGSLYDVGTTPEDLAAGAIPALRPWLPSSLRPLAERHIKFVAGPLGKKLELELWPVTVEGKSTFAFARWRTKGPWKWLEPMKIP